MASGDRYRLEVNDEIPSAQAIDKIKPRYKLLNINRREIASIGLPMPIETVLETTTLSLFENLYPICMKRVEFSYTQLNVFKKRDGNMFIMTNQKIDARGSKFSSDKNETNNAAIALYDKTEYLSDFRNTREYGDCDVWYVTSPYKSSDPYFKKPITEYTCSINKKGLLKFINSPDLTVFDNIWAHNFVRNTFGDTSFNTIRWDSFFSFTSEKFARENTDTCLDPYLVFFSRKKPGEFLNIEDIVIVKFISNSYYIVKKALNNDPDIIRRVLTLVRFSFMDNNAIVEQMTDIMKRGGIRRAETDMSSEKALALLSIIRWFDPARFYTALFYLECFIYYNSINISTDRHEHFNNMRELLIMNKESILSSIQRIFYNDDKLVDSKLYESKYVCEIIKYFNTEFVDYTPSEILSPYMPITFKLHGDVSNGEVLNHQLPITDGYVPSSVLLELISTVDVSAAL